MADSILPEPTPTAPDFTIEGAQRRNQQYRGPIDSAAKATNDGSWFDLGDIAAAPFRGAVDAVHGIYGLADTLTGDALPDWESPLGHSHTFLGSALEGIAQFSVGFLPLGGVGSFAGLLPELGEGAGLLANVGRAAAGAGITAFAAFEGHDKRLSDLIQSVPALQNPITQFLQSNETDSELWGRLKNGLEQAGLASAIEPLFYGLKAFKAKQAAARADGAVAEDVAKAGAEHNPGIQKGLKNLDEGVPPVPPDTLGPPSTTGAPAATAGEGTADLPGGDPSAVSGSEATFQDAMKRLKNLPEDFKSASGKTKAEIEAEFFSNTLSTQEAQKNFLRNIAQELPPEGPNAPVHGETGPAAETAPAPKADPVAELPVDERQNWGLKTLGFDEGAVKNLIGRMGEKEAAAPHLFTPEGAEFGPNVRTTPETDKLLAGISERGINLTSFKNKDGVPVLLSAMSESILPAIKRDFTALDPHTIAKLNQEAFQAVGDIVGQTPERVQEAMLRRVHSGVDQVAELGAVARASKTMLDIVARKNVDHLGFVQQLFDKAPGVEGNLDLELVRADYNLRFHAALQLGVQGMYSELGRALRGAQDITTGMSMGDFLAKASEAGGMANRLPEFDAALASNPKALAAQVNALGGRDFLMGQLAKMKLAYGDGNTAALSKLARMTTAARVAAMTKEFWISALLGSPKTILTNVLSQTGNSIYGPYEKMMGSQLVKQYNGLRGNAIEAAAQEPVLRAAMAQATENAHSIPDVLKLAKLATEGDISIRGTGNALLDPAQRQAAITAQNLGMDPESVGGKVVDFLANALRLPTKILGRSDQVVTQINARTYAKSWLREEALSKGIPIAEHDAYVASRMDQITTGHQFKTLEGVTQQAYEEATAHGLTDPAQVADYAAKRIQTLFPENDQGLVERAISYARDRNFTTPAEPNSISWFLQRMSAQHPMMTAIMPFINTPINLLKWTGQRLDAYGLASYMVGKDHGIFETGAVNRDGTIAVTKNRFLREMLSGDPEQKANAVGRLATGAGLATLATTAAYNGLITGRGPEDPNERKAWLAAGNLPYAVKTSAGHVQFSRLDPVATMFGAAADVMDTIRHMHEEDQPFAKSLMHGLGIAFANNITQKSYLTGIQKITEVLTDPDKNMGNYLQSFAGSFVPNTLNAAVGPAGDDYTREIGSMVDAVRARIPGLSTSLPPQRNIIGEPIQRTTAVGSDVNRWADFLLPVAFKKTSDDVVTSELGRLAYPFSPLSKTVNGQDLTQVPAGQTNAYDRWGELTGTVRIGGDTLRDKLRKLIGSRQYQALEPDIVDKKLSPRADRINAIIHDYRATAFDQLQKELPKLRQYNQTFVNNRQRLRYGLEPSILPVISEQ